jgi:hypothetical protein
MLVTTDDFDHVFRVRLQLSNVWLILRICVAEIAKITTINVIFIGGPPTGKSLKILITGVAGVAVLEHWTQ